MLAAKKIIAFCFVTFLLSPMCLAKGGHFGLAVGTGLPYVTQGSLDYAGSSFSANLSYGVFDITSGTTSVSLTKPELNLRWHPFSGSLYVGLGLGQMTLEATGTDTLTSQTATVKLTSLTATPSLGWMFGKAGGGVFIGIDIGYQNPIDPETTITSILPTNNQTYIDAQEKAEEFGETAIPTFTVKLGYLF